MIQLKTNKKILCAGDIMVDIPIPYGEMKTAIDKIGKGEMCTIPNPSLGPVGGGSIANTASALGKLGTAAYMVGIVGGDEYGDFLIQDIAKDGVRTDYIFRQKEPMSMLLAVLDEVGEKYLFLYNGPGAQRRDFEPRHLTDELAQDVGWIHFNGLANDCLVDFMEKCREAGAVVSFDLNLRCETFGFDDKRKAKIRRAVKTSHILFGSGADEFAPLTGITDLREAAASLSSPDRIVVARNGADPVLLFAGGKCHLVPTTGSEVKVINKVGAGDIFNAGFIAACSRGRTPLEGVIWGNLCASQAISHREHRSIQPLTLLEEAAQRELNKLGV